MATGVMSVTIPSRTFFSLKQPVSRPLRPAGSSAARSLSFVSSSCFSGICIAPRIGFKQEIAQRGSVVKVNAGKAALGCTKRWRSRKSLARAQGFRIRMSSPGGRNLLRRRRAKGRKVLCPRTNPNSGPRA